MLAEAGEDVFINGIQRAHVDLPVDLDLDLALARGDVIAVTSAREQIERFSEPSPTSSWPSPAR